MERLSSTKIRNILKVELHRHLDCSVRWSTLVELSQENPEDFSKSHSELREKFLILDQMTDLTSVLNKFKLVQKIFKSEEILERIAYEACEDAFNDGVRLLELRYAPSFIQEIHPHLSFEKIHNAFLRGLDRAEKKWPLNAGLICIIQRNKSLALAQSICDFVIDHKNTFIGMDLADDESTAEPKVFASLFDKIKKNNISVTIHSGEIPNKQAAQWVKDSINYLYAQRIGHGIQIIQDPDIIDFVIKQKIFLEVCPISNYLTKAFADHSLHPLRKLKEAGVQLSICSDDPGIFGTQLSDDYLIAQEFHNFNLEDFKKTNLDALKASFINDETKKVIYQELIK